MNSFNLSQLFFIGGRPFLWIDNLPLRSLLAVVPLPVSAHHVEGCGDRKSHDLSLLLDAETKGRLIATHKVPARCSNGNALAVSKNSRIFQFHIPLQSNKLDFTATKFEAALLYQLEAKKVLDEQLPLGQNILKIVLGQTTFSTLDDP